MKTLFLGEIDTGQTSLMRLRALERLGHTVVGANTVLPWKGASWLDRQVQRRIGRGSIVDEINESVLRAARAFKPDLVWAEKQEFVRRETLEALRREGVRLIHFTPDPYFHVPWKRTDLMDEAMKAFDVLVYCKAYERSAYESVGLPTIYMPLGYCDEVHRPLPSNEAKWNCAVGFLGGWDPSRESMLEAVARAELDLKIWGGYWDSLVDGKWTLRRWIIMRQLAGDAPFKIHSSEALAPAYQGGEVYGDDYARALSGARIGVGFLRKAWPDQHTTRTFEIPACGSLFLGERTEEHQALFEEGREADFFSSEAELVEKVTFYRDHEDVRARIALAGRRRCESGRYAYVHRLAAAFKEIDSL